MDWQIIINHHSNTISCIYTKQYPLYTYKHVCNYKHNLEQARFSKHYCFFSHFKHIS